MTDGEDSPAWMRVATTLEANAAMRSIVRRDTGESYQEFLTRLAAASGIQTPTREAHEFPNVIDTSSANPTLLL